MRGLPEKPDGRTERIRIVNAGKRERIRARVRARVRIGSFDGLDGRAGRTVRALLSETVARLERAAVQLRQPRASVARTIARLDEGAVTKDPDLADASLEALLEEMSLALGALGQAVGARAADQARATAERLKSAKALKAREVPSDPLVARDLAEVRARRLPDGFEVLSVVRALLA